MAQEPVVMILKLNGKIIKHGEILSAEYEGKNVKESAVLFEYSKGNWDYFNLSGNSLKRAFLKAPLSYRRISSYFTNRRFHPILKKVRPHLGIDYAAPKGTPVSAIGDGIIVFAGWGGGFGNLVKVKHPNGYESWYGHLSKFSKTAKVGKKVFISDVVGYVGSTGLSTGPHLDFRIKKGNIYLNFLKIDLPSKKTIPKNKFSYFKSYAKSELELLKYKTIK
ncbi:MAG: M23 family metallopeptidase [Elusimicrobiota bacterium]